MATLTLRVAALAASIAALAAAAPVAAQSATVANAPAAASAACGASKWNDCSIEQRLASVKDFCDTSSVRAADKAVLSKASRKDFLATLGCEEAAPTEVADTRIGGGNTLVVAPPPPLVGPRPLAGPRPLRDRGHRRPVTEQELNIISRLADDKFGDVPANSRTGEKMGTSVTRSVSQPPVAGRRCVVVGSFHSAQAKGTVQRWRCN